MTETKLSNSEPKLDSSIDSLKSHWDQKAKSETTDCAKVDASLRAQKMRFENFVVHHDLNGASILDVGCGVGDLWHHLQLRSLQCQYLGVDISSEMIRVASEKFPSARFEAANILNWTPEPRFDYVVSFAIHNVRVEQCRELLESITLRQFQLCKKAAHVCLLTDRYSG